LPRPAGRGDAVWSAVIQVSIGVQPAASTSRHSLASCEGVAQGEFEIADLQLTMLAFLGMHNYTYQWVHRYAPLDPVALSKLYCDIFFNGIALRG